MTTILPYILSNLAVAFVIAGLAFAVGRSGRHSALAHVLWVAVFVKLVTPPVAVLDIPVPVDWLPKATQTLPVSHAIVPDDQMIPETSDTAVVEPPVVNVNSAESASAGFRFSWTHAVLLFWAAGFVFVIVRGSRRFLRLQRLIADEGNPDIEASKFVEQLIHRHRHDAGLSLAKSSQTEPAVPAPVVVRLPIRMSPMLFGLGKRTLIVCPDELWQQLSQTERDALLAHETAHFCRRDHWVRWIEWTVSAVYWWLPILFVARRQLERHEEACCDAWAVRTLSSSPRSYAETLLKAVDFMSTQPSAVPRLASQMQPTADLEHRLRLLMKPATARTSATLTGIVMTAIAALLMVHPVLVPAAEAPVSITESTILNTGSVGTENNIAGLPSTNSSVPLVDPPTGFWNTLPETQWASFSLSLPSATVHADCERGTRIQVADRPDLMFARNELTNLVDLNQQNRIVIGSGDGSLRTWDLLAGTAVSLIGRHPQAITSMDYRDGFGLVSGDSSGLITRWNLQSGERLAAYSFDEHIQSVRFNVEGDQVAVVTGSWQQSSQEVWVLDAFSLTPVDSFSVTHPVAVVVPVDDGSWLSVDWSGHVRDARTGETVASIPKMQVSALVFTSSPGVSESMKTGEME